MKKARSFKSVEEFYMEKIKQKSTLSKFIKGYDMVNNHLLKEKKQRLKKLSIRDSLYEYDGLCQLWDMVISKNGMRNIDKQKIKVLLKQRKLLNKIGRILGSQ